jgi:hypothetical protein
MVGPDSRFRAESVVDVYRDQSGVEPVTVSMQQVHKDMGIESTAVGYQYPAGIPRQGLAGEYPFREDCRSQRA